MALPLLAHANCFEVLSGLNLLPISQSCHRQMNKDTSFKKFHCQIKKIEVNINENLGSKNYLRVEMVKLYKRET